MRLYRTSRGRWFGTQADARGAAGKEWAQVEVPTDKEGLLHFLNELNNPAELCIQGDSRPIDIVSRPIEPLAIVECVTALRTDAPTLKGAAPISLTDVEEFIQAADHPRLARITENAIYRMRELLGRIAQ